MGTSLETPCASSPAILPQSISAEALVRIKSQRRLDGLGYNRDTARKASICEGNLNADISQREILIGEKAKDQKLG